MKLETIYNDLVDMINDDMSLAKALKLKEKLEDTIRLETCYKTTPKTRVNAIKKIASKSRPNLSGYGAFGEFKVITDSYHVVMIKEENIPLKLVTSDEELIEKVGKDNCIVGNYPDITSIMDFNKGYYNTIDLDFDDIERYYKLHKKNADKEPYKIGEQYFNIKFIKNVIDVLGTDITIYAENDNENRPLYIENKNGERGVIVPMRRY